MWVGRDLGYDLDLWWRAQQTHQAVAWWMYVAVVADGQLPRRANPIRTLAALLAQPVTGPKMGRELDAQVDAFVLLGLLPFPCRRDQN